jgi:sugar lactone lactonase YvrE
MAAIAFFREIFRSFGRSPDSPLAFLDRAKLAKRMPRTGESYGLPPSDLRCVVWNRSVLVHHGARFGPDAKRTTMKTDFFGKMAFGTTIVLAILGFLAGCATPQKSTKAQPAIFYPSPPDEPRLQFLMSFSSESELRGRENQFASFIVGKAPPPNPINKPYGVAIYRNQIFVCDTGLGAILVADLGRREMRAFAPMGEARMRMPINIAIDRDGTRYVTDTVRGEVLVYGGDGSYRGAFGKAEKTRPIDVAISEDRLYVADLTGHAVRAYSKKDWKPLFTIPQVSTNEESKLFSPTNLALDQAGHLHVSDTGAFHVQQYDLQGNYLRTFGQQGDAPGQFALPKGVAVDREGRVYVVDATMQVVQIFDREGKLLLFFGEPNGNPAGLNLPAKIAIDYEHVGFFQKYAAPGFKLEYVVLVTNQFGDRKVSVYGFGQKK